MALVRRQMDRLRYTGDWLRPSAICFYHARSALPRSNSFGLAAACEVICAFCMGMHPCWYRYLCLALVYFPHWAMVCL